MGMYKDVKTSMINIFFGCSFAFGLLELDY
jgi:hypothetical protein